MYNDLDHPVIRNMERAGYPDGKSPPHVTCPGCGRDCVGVTNMYLIDGQLVGCEVCVDIRWAGELAEELWDNGEE